MSNPRTTACWLATCAALVFTLGWAPASQAAEPPQAIGGAAMFTVPYAIGVGVAADHGLADSGAWMLAPVVGPFVYLAEREGCSKQAGDLEASICGAGDALLTTAAVTSGALQAGGLLMLGLGLATDAEDAAPIVVAPNFGAGHAGLTVMGRF